MLELHYYRPAILRFVAATQRQPELLLTADVRPDEVVVDAGAFRGEWAEAVADRYGVQVHAFEPVRGSYRKLLQRAEAGNGLRPHPFGLSDHDHQATFALDGPGSAASDEPGAFGTASVPMRDVAAVFAELEIGEIAWLKVNIEGGEYALFDRLLETDWLPRVRNVSIQFHEWLPQAHRRRAAIRRALRATHDEVWNYPWVWEMWRRRDEPGTTAPTPGSTGGDAPG